MFHSCSLVCYCVSVATGAVEQFQREIDDVNRRWTALKANDNSSAGSFLAAETTLLQLSQFNIIEAFDPSRPDNLSQLPLIAEEIVRMLVPISRINKMLATRTAIQANSLAKMPDYGATFGSICRACSPDNNDTNVDEEPIEVTVAILQAKKALCHFWSIDSTDFEEAVSDTKLEQFTRLGWPTKNLTLHGLHLAMMHGIISEITMFELYSQLSKDLKMKLLKNAKQLAEQVNQRLRFDDKDMTVLVYIQQFVIPGLRETVLCYHAATVACEIFDTGFSVSSAKRKGQLLPFYKRADSTTANGDQRVGATYCSDPSQAIERKRMARTYLLSLLHRAIERRLPDELFSERRFIQTLLRVCPSIIGEKITCIKAALFRDDTPMKKAVIDKLKENVFSKKSVSDGSNTGKRNIMVENEEQIKCMQKLIDRVSEGGR